jgi:RNA polymerase sigma factor (TIGR02999 family)
VPSGAITELLRAWSDGEEKALDELVPVVQRELRRLARKRLSRESSFHTLQPTELVNEAFLRLMRQRVRWENRAHFFALAASIMRRVLVDHARRKAASKRDRSRIGVAGHVGAAARGAVLDPVDVIDLNDALETLAELDSRQSRIVELRYFGGLTLEEIAEAIDLSPSTVKREWSVAKLWLYDRLQSGNASAAR